ncbi:MAG TPA: LLM class flavin-dependent oxidoreductase [Methylomirabilota bacterium]|nr:LLM class flavin-dependent oxidoreductase [Methylomirabilota bacterium]
MKVAFGVSLSPGTPLLQEKDTRKFIDLAKMANDYGAEAVGTHDTAFIGGDAYVRATLIALGASRARVGLRPTNPLTREPQVMASFLASIDSLTGGRAFMDIASGDSAVLNIGYDVATRARIEDYVTCVRDLLAKGEATYQGRPQRVRWASTVTRQRIPISICAEGPKMLHLAGRIGDGVVAGTGLLPEVIKDTIARVHAGAREAGRDPADVDIWFTTRTSLDDDRDRAIQGVKASVSSILNHSMRFGLDGKHLPDELRAKVQEYVDGYELYDHVLQEGRNPKRMDALGLTNYAIERFALAGNASDWIKRIEQIAEAGARKIWVSLRATDMDTQHYYMKVLGGQIMSRFV